ncbi:hypothetical protein LBMAG27_03050 [Bacteroidota bacterium]|nr:hypothetical protein LBMAG27_03050 [Bacteroidota bacterium]
MLLTADSTAQSTDTRQQVIPKKTNLRVKENKIPCSGYEGQTDCYTIQEGDLIGTDKWEMTYEYISGFNYEPGYIYNLRVKKNKVKHPFMDAPDIQITVIEILSKEKAEPKGD